MKRGQDIIGISATRASAILGLNNWKTPLQAWQEIQEKIKPGFNAEKGFILPDFQEGPALRFGKAFEKAVIKLAEDKQKQEIGDQEKLCSDIEIVPGNYPIIPPAFCYIDGRYNRENPQVLHEGKTTNSRTHRMKWGEPGSDRIPQEVQVQVQHQMLCTGADEVIVSLLVFPKPQNVMEDEGWSVHFDNLNDVYYLSRQEPEYLSVNPVSWSKSLDQMGYFHQYKVESKPDVQKLLRELYDDFWNRYVLTQIAPEEVDYSDIRRTFTAPKGTLVVNDKIAGKMREYKDIGREIGTGGQLAKRQVQLKVEILKFAKDKTTVADDESQEKIVFMDESGNKVGSFNGKTFRS
jgi:hypothetical protein